MDSAGNRTAKTDQLAAVTSNYTYDAIYQLTQVTKANNTTESYSYDVVGNRTASLGVSSYTTNASNEMTANSNASYTYDSNGNTLTKTIGSDTTTYAWDYENRLTSVTLPGSGGTVTFKYDPLGRRIYKSSSGGTSVFAYDGDNLIEETNSSGGAVARYTQTQNIDEPLSMLRSSATSYYQADGLDSIISLTNSSGASAQTYAYDSFGKVTASSGSLVNSFQYTGRELDSETGLYYYRARYYDPGAGRFLSEDPITFTGGIDFYSYVENNPTEFTDALGLQARPMPIPSPAPPAPGPGPVLVPDPAPEPEIAFCMRFPWICAAAAVLLSPKPTDSGGDFGPGNYHNPTLNRHSNSAIQKCANNGCPPCAPPVGTISYRLDSTGPPHNGVPTPHWHLYVMQQNPNNCQCQWVDIPDNQGGFGGGSPPPGTGPIAPAGGGGHP